MYYKIIGNGFGNYPYRIGLNTLKYTGEKYDPSTECGPGGFYFTTAECVQFYKKFGGTLCKIELPEDAKVTKFGYKYKADKIIIKSMIPAAEVNMPLYKCFSSEKSPHFSFVIDHPSPFYKIVKESDNFHMGFNETEHYYDIYRDYSPSFYGEGDILCKIILPKDSGMRYRMGVYVPYSTEKVKRINIINMEKISAETIEENKLDPEKFICNTIEREDISLLFIFITKLLRK